MQKYDFSNQIQGKAVVHYALYLLGVLCVLCALIVLGGGMDKGFLGMIFSLLLFAVLQFVWLCFTEFKCTYVVVDDILQVGEVTFPGKKEELEIPINKIQSLEIKRTWAYPRLHLWIVVADKEYMLLASTHMVELKEFLEQKIK